MSRRSWSSRPERVERGVNREEMREKAVRSREEEKDMGRERTGGKVGAANRLACSSSSVIRR